MFCSILSVCMTAAAPCVQEAPALSSDSGALDAACAYVERQHEHFALQERNVGLARSEIVDGRVHVALYFLPSEPDIPALDVAAITKLATLLPVVPVMCKVRRDALVASHHLFACMSALSCIQEASAPQKVLHAFFLLVQLVIGTPTDIRNASHSVTVLCVHRQTSWRM